MPTQGWYSISYCCFSCLLGHPHCHTNTCRVMILIQNAEKTGDLPLASPFQLCPYPFCLLTSILFCPSPYLPSSEFFLDANHSQLLSLLHLTDRHWRHQRLPCYQSSDQCSFRITPRVFWTQPLFPYTVTVHTAVSQSPSLSSSYIMVFVLSVFWGDLPTS